MIEVGDHVISTEEFEGCPAGTRGRRVKDRHHTLIRVELDKGQDWSEYNSWLFPMDLLRPYYETPFQKSLRDYIDGELAG